MIYILTMIIIAGGSDQRPTTVVAEYTTEERCMAAASVNRQTLSSVGRVILSTCTKK